MGRIKIFERNFDNKLLQRKLPEYLQDEIECLKNMAENLNEQNIPNICQIYNKVYYEAVNNCSDDESCEYFISQPHYVYSVKFKFACVHVNKNATTTIRNIIAHYDLGYEIFGGTMNLGITREVDNNRMVYFYQQPIFKKDVVRFAIWRDPYERLRSSIKNGNYSVEKVMSLIQNYVFNNGICSDQHIRRQSDFYTVNDVDYIVKIEDLDKFLEKVLKIPKEGIIHTNVSSKKMKYSFFHFNDEQKKFFDEYYAPDYKLLESDKVWHPEEK